MPIYEFKCDGCGAEGEEQFTFSQYEARTVKCLKCGQVMRRKFSPAHFTIPETGRDKVLGVLNNEPGGRRLPGGHQHSKRYEAALAKGIDGSQRDSQLGQFRPVKGARA